MRFNFYLIDGGEMQVYVAFETGIEIIYSAKPRQTKNQFIFTNS